MSRLKEIIVTLYWLPNIVRTLWKVKNGRFFVFRDEPNGFLRWMLQAREESRGKDCSQDILNHYEQAVNEVAARKRRGEWTC